MITTLLNKFMHPETLVSVLKKLNFYLLLLALSFTFSFCSSERKDGDWDDNIKLSQKQVLLTSSHDSVLITTKGKSWWIDGISLNGDNVEFDKPLATKSDFIIKNTAFIIERKSSTEIHIEMTENQTGVERILNIGLQAGDYFDGIKIIQSKN